MDHVRGQLLEQRNELSGFKHGRGFIYQRYLAYQDGLPHGVGEIHGAKCNYLK